jgi:hypothetical protein
MLATMAAYAVAYPLDKMWIVPGLIRVDMTTLVGSFVARDIWGTIFRVRFPEWGHVVS